jgi:Ca-activated chloride channel homolog
LQSDAGNADVGYYGGSTIVVLSDGENISPPDPLSVAQVASVAGVHVHTIGVGTEAGAVVQVGGFNIATALNSDLLKQVASVTDGSYHAGTDASALAAVSRSIHLRFKLVTQHTEVTAVLCGAAIALLLVAAALSMRSVGRVI